MSKEKRAQSAEENRYIIEKLVENAIQGDKEALSELCKQTAKDILFSVTRIMGKNDGAEDISQEVLLRVCKGIKNLKDPKTFHGWLAKIIVNEKNRYIGRQIGRGETMNLDEYVDTIEEDREDFLPGVSAEKGETRDVISAAVSTLPMRQREAVMLHYYHNLSVTETAEAMGVASQTVSRYLKLAHEKLKGALEMHSLAPKRIGLQKVSIGAVLAGTLRAESAMFTQAAEAFELTALAACNQVIFAEAAVIVAAEAATVAAAEGAASAVATSAAGGATISAGAGASASAAAGAGAAAVSGYVLAGVCFVAACIVTIAALFPGAEYVYDPVTLAQMEFTEINSAAIVFYGGEGCGYNMIHVNPEQAAIYIDADGETEVVEWWIIAAGSEIPLIRGYDEIVGNALPMLRSQSAGGEYFIYFRIYAQDGVFFIASSNFYLRD